MLAAGPDRPLRDRQFRRYYDIFKLLATAPVREAAPSDLELLRAVAEHKRRFFPAVWARYAEAIPGIVTLAPSCRKTSATSSGPIRQCKR